MSYTPNDWNTGDVITATLLDHLETQYAAVLDSDLKAFAGAATFASYVRWDGLGYGRAFTYTIANNGTQAFTGKNGLLLLFDTASAGRMAGFYVRGAQNGVNEVFDPIGFFSHTLDTATSINCYYSGGYFIQNKTGGEITVTGIWLAID